jgi:hypothetical protein
VIRRALAALVLTLALCGPQAASAQVTVPVVPCAANFYALCGALTFADNNGTAITTATTTPVVSSLLGQRLFIFYAAVLTSGTNTSNTFNFEWSLSTTCASGNTLLSPTAIAPGATSGLVTTEWSGTYQAGVALAGWQPASFPIILPAGSTLCIVTAGTTTALYPIIFSSTY